MRHRSRNDAYSNASSFAKPRRKHKYVSLRKKIYVTRKMYTSVKVYFFRKDIQLRRKGIIPLGADKVNSILSYAAHKSNSFFVLLLFSGGVVWQK